MTNLTPKQVVFVNPVRNESLEKLALGSYARFFHRY